MSTPKASDQSVPGRRFNAPLRNIVIVASAISLVTFLITLVLNLQQHQAKYQDCLAQNSSALSCATLRPDILSWSTILDAGYPVFFILFFAHQLFLSWREGLWISADGVECTYSYYSYRTTWDNIERFAHGPFGLIGITYDQLILREPAMHTGRRVTLHVPKNIECVIPIGLYSLVWRLIPIGYFPSPGRAEAIRQEIGKYAPRLLIEGAQANVPPIRSPTNG